MTEKATITGAELVNFYTHHWPKDWWHEDSEYEIQDEMGEMTVREDAIFELSRLGYLHNEKGETMPFSRAWEIHRQDPNAPVLVTLAIPGPKRDELIRRLGELNIQGLRILNL